MIFALCWSTGCNGSERREGGREVGRPVRRGRPSRSLAPWREGQRGAALVSSPVPITVRRVDSPETTSGHEGQPQGDRATAEMLYQFAVQTFDAIGYEQATPAELAAQTPAERLANAQLLVLQAIYLELRHGDDQVTAQTAALAEHADAMDKLHGALMEHADALSRYRSRD